jgi:hypothetical protein
MHANKRLQIGSHNAVDTAKTGEAKNLLARTDVFPERFGQGLNGDIHADAISDLETIGNGSGGFINPDLNAIDGRGLFCH